jgi:hypothetical protein
MADILAAAAAATALTVKWLRDEAWPAKRASQLSRQIPPNSPLPPQGEHPSERQKDAPKRRKQK